MEVSKYVPIKWNFQNVAYGYEPNQKLDLSIPKVKAANVIVYIHGGAFLVGNKLQYPSFLSNFSENTIISSIDYRLLNDNNDVHMADILSDINNALMKIIELAANDVVVKNFILIGHSAGGHIGLLYSYKYFSEKIKIAACISLAGPTDFTDDGGWSSMRMWGDNLQARLSFLSQMGSKLTGFPIGLTQADWTKQKNYSEFKKQIMDISPVTFVSGRIPPTLIVHARSDDQVPYSNAVRLKSALINASVPHKLITPAGNGNNHMLGGIIFKENSPVIFENQPWVIEVSKWIETFNDLGAIPL
jgi:acetyl esterase/lipase